MNRTVTTKHGKLTGVMSNIQKYTVFKGIPFAKPPIGDLRWKEPQEVDDWQDNRLCDKFGPAAIQPDWAKGDFYEVEFYQGGRETSEDCLYLNVWTDLEKTDMPVMVWIHGGAFTHGFSHEMEFDGDAIVKRGVILVSVNYRVGALGFMAHPELTRRDGHSGNYGILDQIAALKWVKENISAFGGNPDNVTIFGQSAGAFSVETLMASPLCKNLFNRAIHMSGGAPGASRHDNPSQELMETVGEKFCELSGMSLSDLYKLSGDEILRLYQKAQENDMRMTVCVDNYSLAGDVFDVLNYGEANDKSVMSGSVSGDAGLFSGNGDNGDERSEAITYTYGLLRANEGKRGYYAYHFKRDIPGDDHPGAFHSSDLWYVFGTLMRSNRPFTGADYDLSLKMTDWWTNFAKTGNPGGGWTEFTGDNVAINEIDIESHMVDISERPLAKELSDGYMKEVNG